MNKSNSALCRVCQYRNICIPESLLPSLQEPSVQKIASDLAQQISFAKGKLVYRQGDEFQSIFTIRSGCIKTYSLDKNGEELIEGLFFPGEFLALDCISFKRYSHFAVATEDSDLCLINYHNLEALASRESQLALHISKAISGQLSKQLRWAQSFLKGNSEQRLITWIFIVSSKLKLEAKSSYQFPIPVTKAEIAKLLQMRPESLSRVITKLNKEGLINFVNKECIVNNKKRLFERSSLK
ncbi:MAG TPA: Crp/Fnr family transcriptional regulator [Gammaproteobacteria bacterium]|nr:Crp/Fnr family transcriptional regulator [Gammaproteobacteria bacterium]